MITVTATSGNQVEGTRLDSEIETKLFAALNDGQKATAANDYLLSYMALVIAINEGMDLGAAVTYVQQHTTRIN